MPSKFAILVDGGFVKKKLKARNHHFPTIIEISAEIERIKAHPSLSASRLLRVYFYDAPPASGTLQNPISNAVLDLASHPDHSKNLSLQQLIEMLPDTALRSGETAGSVKYGLGATLLFWLLVDTANPARRMMMSRTLIAKSSCKGRS